LTPERIAELERIARYAADRFWRARRSQLLHGLGYDDLVAVAVEALLRVLPQHDGRADSGLLHVRAYGAVVDAVRAADPVSRDERERADAAPPVTVHERWPPRLGHLLAAYDEEAEARLARQDAARMVGDALAELSAEDRALLARIYRDDVLPADVARERVVSEATIGRQHRRALRRLEHAIVSRNGRCVLQER
jgi:RNA polymerase sigma factor (sigma-70 family)